MKQVFVLIALIALAFVIFNGTMALGNGGNKSIDLVSEKLNSIDNIVESPDEYTEYASKKFHSYNEAVHPGI